jgi:hypothetical protein
MSGHIPEKVNDKRNMLLPIVCIREQASNLSRWRAQANRSSREDCRATGEA